MTVTLHNVQRTVNRDIALCALHPRSVRSEDGRMNLAKIRHARGLSQRDLGEMIWRESSASCRCTLCIFPVDGALHDVQLSSHTRRTP